MTGRRDGVRGQGQGLRPGVVMVTGIAKSTTEIIGSDGDNASFRLWKLTDTCIRVSNAKDFPKSVLSRALPSCQVQIRGSFDLYTSFLCSNQCTSPLTLPLVPPRKSSSSEFRRISFEDTSFRRQLEDLQKTSNHSKELRRLRKEASEQAVLRKGAEENGMLTMLACHLTGSSGAAAPPTEWATAPSGRPANAGPYTAGPSSKAALPTMPQPGSSHQVSREEEFRNFRTLERASKRFETFQNLSEREDRERESMLMSSCVL